MLRLKNGGRAALALCGLLATVVKISVGENGAMFGRKIIGAGTNGKRTS
jgi:hypothetical protein